MVGRLPSSVYEAGFHLSSQYTSRLTVLLSDGKGSAVRWLMQRAAMADAMRCDGRCNALRWPLQRAAFSVPLLHLARDGVAFAPLHAIPSKRAVRWKTPHSSFCSDRECRIQGYVADQRWRGITAFHLAQFLTLQKTDAPQTALSYLAITRRLVPLEARRMFTPFWRAPRRMPLSEYICSPAGSAEAVTPVTGVA